MKASNSFNLVQSSRNSNLMNIASKDDWTKLVHEPSFSLDDSLNSAVQASILPLSHRCLSHRVQPSFFILDDV
ncbi:hypothetical protein Tco_0510727 [Tanacetum coccineum]